MSKFVLTAQLQLQAPTNVGQVVNQIQRQLNNVNVDVQVQGASAAQKQLKNVTKATDEATSSAQRMGKAFAVSIKRFAAFSIATRAVGLFTNTLGGAVTEAIAFERQLIKVAQVTGKSIDQLADLTKEISRLSTGMGVASKSLLEVSRSLSQAGLSAKDTRIALASLAKTELAPTFANITQTTEGAIAVMAQFKQGAAGLEKQLGAINAVAGQFAVEAGDLISVIRRTGGVFREAGGDLNELIGLFTSVRATTRESAESIATGLRTIFTRIQRPKTIEFMKQFGVELVGMDGKFVGAYEAVGRLSEALKGLEQGDIRFIKIAEQLGGFRQIGKVIPLLKEFRVAEEARQAAIAGGESLTKDAAAAQETLAVKFGKVQEAFLKLIRDITKTSTFQIMANSAIALADSLIKIADAIKPLIPLLAALAALKMAKMFGGFGSGLVSGMKNMGAQGKNQGGRIMHFARGGDVPGHGNRDTVPAMLQPGEFVIKKSSAKQIGSKQLRSMNRYGYGGGVANLKTQDNAIGLFGFKEKGSEGYTPVRFDPNRFEVKSGAGIAGINALGGAAGNKMGRRAAAAQGVEAAWAADKSNFRSGGLSGEVEAFRKSSGNREATQSDLFQSRWDSGHLSTTGKAITRSGGAQASPQRAAAKGQSLAGLATDDQAMDVTLTGSINAFAPYPPSSAKGKADFHQSIKTEAGEAVANGMESLIQKTQSWTQLGAPVSADKGAIDAIKDKIKADTSVTGSMAGFMFEGIINAFTGAAMAGGTTAFDFPESSIQAKGTQLGNLFSGKDGAIAQLLKADAKPDKGSVPSVVDKLRQDIQLGNLSGIMHAAEGGSISDTVPAMLTPGEFVFNKGAAKRIGSKNLNRMNKSGVTGMAAGGAVGGIQYFGNGGGVDVGQLTRELQELTRAADMAEKAMLETAGALQRGHEMGQGKTSQKGGSNWRAANDPRYQGDMKRREDEAFKAMEKGESTGLARDEKMKQRDTAIQEARAAKETQKTQSVARHRQQQAAPSAAAKPTNALSVIPTAAEKAAIKSRTTYTPPTPLARVDPVVTGRGSTLPANAPPSGPTTRTDALHKPTGGIKKRGKGDPLTAIKMILDELEKRFKGFISKALKPAEKFFDMLGKAVTQLKDQFVAMVKTLQAHMGTKQAEITTDQQLLVSDQSHLLVTDANTQSIVEETRATKQLVEEKGKETKAGLGAMGMFFALQTALSMFSSNIEDTDGFFTGMRKSGMKFAMHLVTAGFLLMQLGVQMNAAGIGIALKTLGAKIMILGNRMSFAGLSTMKFGSSLMVAGRNIKAASTGMIGAGLAIAAAFYLVAGAFKRQAENAKKVAIEAGHVQMAGAQAVSAANWGLVSVIGAVAIALAVFGVAAHGGALAVWSFALPVIAAAAALTLFLTAIGALDPVLNALRDTLAVFGIGDSTATIRLKAEAEAQATKTTEALRLGFEDLEKQSKDVADGLTTATAALKSHIIVDAMKEAAINIQMAGKIGAGEAKGFWRRLGEFATEVVTLGLADTDVSAEEVAGRRAVMDQMLASNTPLNTAEKKHLGESVGIEADELEAYKKARSELVKVIMAESELRSKSVRENIVAGTALATHLGFLANQIDELKSSGAWDKLGIMEQQELIHLMNTEYHNAAKAIIDNIERLQAFNFGLGETEGVVALAHANLNNLSDAFNTGTVEVQSSINKLTAVIESGASMDPAEFKESLDKVNQQLNDFGIDPRTSTNLTNQFEALNAATGLFRESTMGFLDDMSDERMEIFAPEKFNNELMKRISQDMQSQRGISKTEADRLVDMMPELTSEEAQEVMNSNLGVLEDKFGEINDKLKRQLELVGQIAELTQVAVKENARRLEAEQAVFAAQRKSVDMQMQAAKIAAKHGGKAVDEEKMRQSAIKRANVGIARSGLNALSTGSVAEIQQRNSMIRFGVGAVSARGRSRVAGGEKYFGAGGRIDETGRFTSEGQATEAQEKALRQAQQEQLRTIKDLIAAEEKHLKTIEEKNRLERESLSSLIDGDVEEFLKKQAAVGATAAVATGDSRLAGLFGAEAMAGAFKNLKTQQKAGVSTLFGQTIGGAGGLLETAAGASLAQRGVTDPRMARLMAQTTGAEEGSRKTIRDLAGVLGETGELGVDLAQTDLKTAEFRVGQAVIKIGKAREDATAKTAQMEDRRERQRERTDRIKETAKDGVESSKAAMDAYDQRKENNDNIRKLTDAALNDNTIFVRDTHAHGLSENIRKQIMQMDTGQRQFQNSLDTGTGQEWRPQPKIMAFLSQGIPLMKNLHGPATAAARNTGEMSKVFKAMKTAWVRGGVQGQGLGARLARVGAAGRGAFGQTAFGRGIAGGMTAARGGMSNFRAGYGIVRGTAQMTPEMMMAAQQGGSRMGNLGARAGGAVNYMRGGMANFRGGYGAGRGAAGTSSMFRAATIAGQETRMGGLGARMAGMRNWFGGGRGGGAAAPAANLAKYMRPSLPPIPFDSVKAAKAARPGGLMSGLRTGWGGASRLTGAAGGTRMARFGHEIGAMTRGAASIPGHLAAGAGHLGRGAAMTARGAYKWSGARGAVRTAGLMGGGALQGMRGLNPMAGAGIRSGIGYGGGATARVLGYELPRFAGQLGGELATGAGRMAWGGTKMAGRAAGWAGGHLGRAAWGGTKMAGRGLGTLGGMAGRTAMAAPGYLGGKAGGMASWMGGQAARPFRYAGGVATELGRGIRAGAGYGTYGLAGRMPGKGMGLGSGRSFGLGRTIARPFGAARQGIANLRGGFGAARQLAGGVAPTAELMQATSQSRMARLGARVGGSRVAAAGRGTGRFSRMISGTGTGMRNIGSGLRTGFRAARGVDVGADALKAMSSTRTAAFAGKVGGWAGKVTGVSKVADAMAKSKWARKLLRSKGIGGKVARGAVGFGKGTANLYRGVMTGMAGAHEMNLGMRLGRSGTGIMRGGKLVSRSKSAFTAMKGAAAGFKGTRVGTGVGLGTKMTAGGLKGLKATKMGGAGMKAGGALGRVMPWLFPAIGAAVGGMEAGGITKVSGKQMGVSEGMLLGALTGSAGAGDSMLSGVGRFFGADIRAGGQADRNLGVLGAAGMGAMTGAGIGGMIGGVPGAAIGAGVGAVVGTVAELYKNFTQQQIPEIRNDAQDLEQAGGDYMDSLPTGVSMLPVSRQAAAARREASRAEVQAPGEMSQEEAIAFQKNVNQRMAAPGLVSPAGGPAGAAGAGLAQATDPEFLTQVVGAFGANIAVLATSLDKFNQQLSSNINELKNLKFQVKLDTTNVNINFNGTSFLQQLSASVKDELLREIATQIIPNLKHDGLGGHVQDPGTGSSS